MEGAFTKALVWSFACSIFMQKHNIFLLHLKVLPLLLGEDSLIKCHGGPRL